MRIPVARNSALAARGRGRGLHPGKTPRLRQPGGGRPPASLLCRWDKREKTKISSGGIAMNAIMKKVLVCILGIFILLHAAQAAENETAKEEKASLIKVEEKTPGTTAPKTTENKPSKEEKGTQEQVKEKSPEKSGAVSLDEIVVTATKTPKTLWNVPAAVSVVTKEDLQRKNYINLNQALEIVPGVSSFAGRGLATSSPVVNMRGFHGHMRTLVLVNGQPICPNLYSLALVQWSAVPVDAVERIEVVRGPFSALYGGDAVGGVINIITKCPDKLGALLRGGFGDRQTYKAHASGSNRFWDKLNVYISYDRKMTDNYVSDFNVLRPTTAGAATPVTGAIPQGYASGGASYYVGDKGQLFYDESTFTLNSKLDISDSSHLRVNALFSEYLMDPFNNHTYLTNAAGVPITSGKVRFNVNGSPVYLSLTPGGFCNPRGEKAMGIYNAEYVNKITDKLDLKLTAGVTNFAKEIYFSPGTNAVMNGGPGTITESPGNIINTEIQANYWVWSKFLLTGGFNYRYDNGRYSRYNALNWKDRDSKTTLIEAIFPSSNRYGVYFQGELHLFDKLVIYPGVRYDSWDSQATRNTPTTSEELTPHNQDAVSPKLAIVYNPLKDTTFRLSGGKAFRVPNFFELYQPLTMANTVYIPNSDLKPEITWGWEAGIEQRLFNNLTKIGITYFENYTRDYIDSRTYTIGNTTYNLRDNIGKVQNRGLEVELHQKITKYFNLFANYTYTDAVIRKYEGHPDYINKTPRYVPQNMFNAGVDFKYDRFKASVITHYVSRMFVNNLNDTQNWKVYGVQDRVDWVTDLTLGVDITKYFNATFTINNLFDYHYYQYNLQQGRSYFGIVTLKY